MGARREVVQSSRVPASRCPGCRADLSAATGHGTPKAGDLSICLDCGALLEFDTGLRAQPVSADAERALPIGTQSEIAILRRGLNAVARPA